MEMFWFGFNSVFALLLNALGCLFIVVTILVCILVTTLFFSEIHKYVMKKLLEKDSPRGILNGRHVIITGGSSGIGKCLAILAAQKGANVTIIARNVERLRAARDEIAKACCNENGQHVGFVSLELDKDYEKIEETFAELQYDVGTCYMLFNCAGTAVGGKIEDTTPQILERMMNCNFTGTYYCTKAVVPKMKEAKEGKIVIVSSQAALLGIFGYSAYCSSKFALRGLAESLSMELQAYGITVTLSLPPDTDTPGFAEEEKTKPLETKLISQSAALVQPETVAEKLMDDTLDGNFFSIVGFESFLLTTLCCGMSPYTSFLQLILESMLMGTFRIISAFYLGSFQRIIKRCMKERKMHKKSE